MTNQKPEIPIPTLDMHKEFVRRSKECKSIEEMLAKDGPMNFMFKDMIQALLAAEMTEHLGYERSDARSKHTDNARNGTFKKTLKTSLQCSHKFPIYTHLNSPLHKSCYGS